MINILILYIASIGFSEVCKKLYTNEIKKDLYKFRFTKEEIEEVFEEHYNSNSNAITFIPFLNVINAIQIINNREANEKIIIQEIKENNFMDVKQENIKDLEIHENYTIKRNKQIDELKHDREILTKSSLTENNNIKTKTRN